MMKNSQAIVLPAGFFARKTKDANSKVKRKLKAEREWCNQKEIIFFAAVFQDVWTCPHPYTIHVLG
jgi:hypothetical protein